jgi:hypothetical protein
MAKAPPQKTKTKKPAPPPPTKVAKPRINYQLTTLGSNNRGEKIIVYGVTGIGKTTLCALVPNPAFISLDGGADKIVNPVTGEKLLGINAETFADVRGALQSNVFESVDTIIIDHITELQHLALDYTFQTIPKEKSNEKAKNVENYGYHKGYRYWYDTMRLILPDCDRWCRKGKNIIFIAQESIAKWAQSDTEDFVMAAPELYHDKSVSVLTAYLSWADHIFRIRYSGLTVEDGKAAPVKNRAVYIHPDATFFAKSRTIPAEFDVVTFENTKDNSIWRLVFGEG